MCHFCVAAPRIVRQLEEEPYDEEEDEACDARTSEPLHGNVFDIQLLLTTLMLLLLLLLHFSCPP